MAGPELDADVKRVYGRLLRYTARYRGVLVIAAVAMALTAVVEASMALLLEPLTDEALVAEGGGFEVWVPLAFVAVFVFRGLAGFATEYSLGWIGRRIIQTLRAQVMDQYLVLPATFFDKRASGRLLSRVTYDIEMIAESATNVVVVMIRDSLSLVAFIAVMIYQSVVLFACVAVVVPLIALIVRILSRTFRRYSARIQESIGDITQVTEEAVQGNRVVKIFDGENYERRRFASANDENRALNMKLVRAKAAGVAVNQILFAIGGAVVIFVAGYETAAGRLTPGSFTSFMGAMILLLPPLRRLTNINASLQRGIAAAQSVFEVLDEPPEADSGERRLDRADGAIEFDDVSFGYDGDERPVLSHIDLSVRPGETLAIVGRSGSGKSTLVSLLPRFYDPSSGSIRLDGVDLAEYRLADLRRQISLVSQDVTLFNDTIAYNIAYGTGVAGREEVVEAARAARIHDFIAALP
ncbi:MAG: ABC transporter transmembrane domain-containing protein, partial [Pseudomonadota bacterium]